MLSFIEKSRQALRTGQDLGEDLQGFTVGVYQIHLVGLEPNISLAEHEIVGDAGGGE